MPDVHIRRTAAADLPALTRLWQTAFGDPPELIGAFYDRFPPETSTWVVEADGNVATAAHLLATLFPAPMPMRSPPIRRSRGTAMRRR